LGGTICVVTTAACAFGARKLKFPTSGGSIRKARIRTSGRKKKYPLILRSHGERLPVLVRRLTPVRADTSNEVIGLRFEPHRRVTVSRAKRTVFWITVAKIISPGMK
jgi:hypothetical protein